MFNYKLAIKLSIFLSIASVKLLGLSADEVYQHGMKHLTGLNTNRDIEKAKRAFVEALYMGHIKARQTFSFMYLDMDNLTMEDLVRLESAADENCEHAQFILANYYRGESNYNFGNYLNWMHKAALNGHYQAQMELANNFKSSENILLAIPYYELAAKQGCFIAKTALAEFYATSGKEQDHERAFALINDIKANNPFGLSPNLTKFYDDYLLSQKLKNNENAELQSFMSKELKKIFEAHEKRRKQFMAEKSQSKVSTPEPEDNDSDEYSEHSKSSSAEEDQALLE